MPSPPEPVMGTEQDVIGARVGAFLIDSVLSIVVATVAAILVVAPGRASRSAFLLVFLAVNLLYFVVTEGLWGQTPAKRLLGVVVVRRDGSPCGLGGSFVRNFLRLIDGIMYYAVGLVVMLLSAHRQRIGDHLADTVVVRAR